MEEREDQQAATAESTPDVVTVVVERMRAWVQALRSGDFAQGKRRLCGIGLQDSRYCCLGVAMEIAIATGVDVMRTPRQGGVRYADPASNAASVSFLLPIVTRWYGLPTGEVDDDGEVANDVVLNVPETVRVKYVGEVPHQLKASLLNDDWNFPFDDIADCVEFTFLPDDWQATCAARGGQ